MLIRVNRNWTNSLFPQTFLQNKLKSKRIRQRILRIHENLSWSSHLSPGQKNTDVSLVENIKKKTSSNLLWRIIKIFQPYNPSGSNAALNYTFFKAKSNVNISMLIKHVSRTPWYSPKRIKNWNNTPWTYQFKNMATFIWTTWCVTRILRSVWFLSPINYWWFRYFNVASTVLPAVKCWVRSRSKLPISILFDS